MHAHPLSAPLAHGEKMLPGRANKENQIYHVPLRKKPRDPGPTVRVMAATRCWAFRFALRIASAMGRDCWEHIIPRRENPKVKNLCCRGILSACGKTNFAIAEFTHDGWKNHHHRRRHRPDQTGC